MKINFIVDAGHKLHPLKREDKAAIDKMREKVGARYTFEVLRDRSTLQHRMYHAILRYAIYASEGIQRKYSTPEALHAALKWQFCMLNPQFFISTKVYINGNTCEAKVPFSESPHNGLDSAGMCQYMDYAMTAIADVIGITVQALQSQSEQYRRDEI